MLGDPAVQQVRGGPAAERDERVNSREGVPGQPRVPGIERTMDGQHRGRPNPARVPDHHRRLHEVAVYVHDLRRAQPPGMPDGREREQSGAGKTAKAGQGPREHDPARPRANLLRPVPRPVQQTNVVTGRVLDPRELGDMYLLAPGERRNPLGHPQHRQTHCVLPLSRAGRRPHRQGARHPGVGFVETIRLVGPQR
jgi:hypothetical protein